MALASLIFLPFQGLVVGAPEPQYPLASPAVDPFDQENLRIQDAGQQVVARDHQGGPPLWRLCPSLGGHHEVDCEYSCGQYGVCYVNATTHCTIRRREPTWTGWKYRTEQKWTWIKALVGRHPNIPPKCRDRLRCPSCDTFGRL